MAEKLKVIEYKGGYAIKKEEEYEKMGEKIMVFKEKKLAEDWIMNIGF